MLLSMPPQNVKLFWFAFLTFPTSTTSINWPNYSAFFLSITNYRLFLIIKPFHSPIHSATPNSSQAFCSVSPRKKVNCPLCMQAHSPYLSVPIFGLIANWHHHPATTSAAAAVAQRFIKLVMVLTSLFTTQTTSLRPSPWLCSLQQTENITLYSLFIINYYHPGEKKKAGGKEWPKRCLKHNNCLLTCSRIQLHCTPFLPVLFLFVLLEKADWWIKKQ